VPKRFTVDVIIEGQIAHVLKVIVHNKDKRKAYISRIFYEAERSAKTQ
jgi:hypothetical protein